MSIDKKGFRYRLSNVLAWFGFSALIGMPFLWVAGFVAYTLSPVTYRGPSSDDFNEPLIIVLLCYLGCALVNYLMVGSPRLLPWRDIEDQE